jgi:Flp pilus assembly protein TadG
LRVRLRGGEEGQSLVEFAFMVPILFMALTGIFEVSLSMWNWQSLNQGADAAARFLAVNGTPGSLVGLPITDPCQAAFTQITSLSTGLDSSQITVTYTLAATTPSVTTFGPFTGATANTCSGQGGLLTLGGNETVVVTYPCNIFAYKLSSIFAGCKIGATKTEFAYN